MIEDNYVYLGFRGDFNLDDFVSRIGIQPTKRVEKKSIGPSSNFPKQSVLRYGQKHASQNDSVADFYSLADQVVDELAPFVEEIKQAIDEFEVDVTLQFVVWISTDEEKATPVLGLSNRAIQFAGTLGASVDIDSYRG